MSSNEPFHRTTKNTLTLAALSALLGLLVIVGAHCAAADPGFYIGARAGTSLAGSSDVPQPSTVSLDWKTKTGPSVAGALGYQFEQPLRLEFDAAYRRNSLSGNYQERIQVLIFPPCGQPNRPCIGPHVNGRAAASSFHAMGFYDIPLAPKWRLSLGAGVGAGVTDLKITAVGSYLDGTSRTLSLVDSGKTVFSARGAVQAAYDLGPTTIFAGYAFTRTANVRFSGQGNLGFSFQQHLSNHALELGARRSF